MNMPGFNAEEALYEIHNCYRMGLTESALVGKGGAVPQQNRFEGPEPSEYSACSGACKCCAKLKYEGCCEVCDACLATPPVPHYELLRA